MDQTKKNDSTSDISGVSRADRANGTDHVMEVRQGDRANGTDHVMEVRQGDRANGTNHTSEVRQADQANGMDHEMEVRQGDRANGTDHTSEVRQADQANRTDHTIHVRRGDFASGTDDISLPKLYERYRCPAEIVLPYAINGLTKNPLMAYSGSRFKKSLWNMDFPWLVVMGVSVLGAAVAALFVFASKFVFASTTGSSAVLALSVFGAFPIIFAVLSPLAYPLSVIINLKTGWGSDWTRTLLGPTHIGLTDSGFKLYVRGYFFYNFPNLAIWPEVFDVDLVTDSIYDTVSLRFVYQTGFGRAPIQLPLTGFASTEDLLFVLTSFVNHVEPSHQGSFFKEMATLSFAPIVDSFETGSLATLEQSLLLEQSSSLLLEGNSEAFTDNK